MGNFCACMITTSPQIMPPKCVSPMHTNSITQPLHTVHTGHVSATFSVSIYCARQADAAPRTAPRTPRAPRGQHPQTRNEPPLAARAPSTHTYSIFGGRWNVSTQPGDLLRPLIPQISIDVKVSGVGCGGVGENRLFRLVDVGTYARSAQFSTASSTYLRLSQTHTKFPEQKVFVLFETWT